jgi:methyl-accepting chemotaxis protein WspA
MWEVNRLPLKAKLALLVSVFLVGLTTMFGVSYWTLTTVQIGGLSYRRIIASKDLVADVLPPPEYIIESYLLTREALDEHEPAALRALIERGKKLREEFETRHAYWQEHLEGEAMRREMLKHAYVPAMRFYELRDRELEPALLAGRQEAAAALVRGPLREQYEQHRKVIDRIVAAALADQTRHEGDAEGFVLGAKRSLWGLALGLTLLSLFVASRIMRALLAKLRGSSVALSSTATQIAATSREQQATINSYSASTTEIAASVREISATSQELLRTMDEVEGLAQRARDAATEGKSGLSEMDEAMKQLSSSTAAISGKLSVIREKAHGINMVVTTITKVADQTNLLSVNAAIEAEKAGEYGLGFLVVAREIRRLADQSAVSTLDIEQMVRHMQSAVSAGVMEMDRFAEEVRKSVSTMQQTGRHFSLIIDHVQLLVERFGIVNEGMKNQSEGARQISEAMAQLTDGAKQTATSLREFNAATESLRRVVDGLREELATSSAQAA